MFTLDGISYTQDDFADYLANKIKVDSANTCQSSQKYKEWVDQTCLDYEFTARKQVS